MSRRFGAYEIVEEVGRGGMGVVYHAREMALDRDVALKVILEDSVAVPIFRARFERESRLAASIDHPHIVAVHAVGEHDGRPYIAMQWINGGDLRSRLREGPMSVADAVRVGRQIAEALQAAHERGLLHRDVKPGNVMLRRGSRIHAMLGDFGIARTSEASLELTRTGEVVGTPLYSAPEQFSGAGAQTASDVYSLGCVLYACLTGKAPYADSDNVAVVYMAHMQGERPHVRASRPDVPEALDALVYATLAVDPAERPTAAELATRLEEIERDMSLGVDTPPPRTTGNAATVLNPPTPPPDPPTAKLQQQPTAKRKVPTPIASPGGGGEPPAVAPPATGGGGGRGRMVAALAVLTLVLGAVLVVLLVAGKGDDTGAKGRQASATVTSEPTETSTETGTVTATPTTTETPTATAQPQRTETVTGPNRFAGPADIALLSPTSSQPIAQARQVLGHYLHAYANRDLDEMQNLLAAGITRYGRLADGFCGQHSGRAAVGNDYAYNFSHVADVYYLYGLANADAFEVLQDGSVLTHGLRFSIGDTTPEPIRFLMRGTSLAGVEAYCKD